MNTVCLSCLNKINTEEKSYMSGTEIYHETCFINKVMGKAYKYANQIRALEPEQIVFQLFGSDKFKLTEDELQVVKSQQSIKPPNPNNLNSTIDKILSNIDIRENIIVDAMYNSLSNTTNSSTELFKNFSKNEFKTLIDSSLNLVLNDNEIYEQIIGENPMSFETTFSNPEALTNKLLESLPEELKNKITNLKNQVESNPSNFSFFSTIPIANLVKTDVDTESDSDSKNEVEFEQPDLD